MTSDYWVSTQCNHWIVNRAQLAIARAEDEEYATSPEEYAALRIWLINCICALTKRLSLRQRITATSIVFFHRFYSCSPGNSLASTDPPLVATACVYVASKVEETPVHIRNVVQESVKMWAEVGHWKYPNDVTSLAEMEFYLLEDLQFHLIVYHPYRSLVTIHTASGKGATKLDAKLTSSSTWTNLLAASAATHASTPATSATGPIGSGDLSAPSSFMDPDLAYGSPGAGLSGRKVDGAKATENGEIEKIKQLDKQSQIRVMQEMIDERHRMFLYGGDDTMPLPRLEELDEQVLQMAWFVLNDTYRTDVLLLYPPHLVAVASIFLAIVLHDATRERMIRSKRWMDDRRDRYRANLLDPKESKRKAAAATAAAGANGSVSRPVGISNVSTGTPTFTGKTMDGIGSTPPVLGASPPKPLVPNALSPPSQPSQPQRPPLRGLASLPPRPAHLPMKPLSAHSAATPQQSPQIGTSPAHGESPAGKAESPAAAAAARVNVPPAAASDMSPAIAAAAELNAGNPPVPPADAMTFLASLNVDLNSVGEIVQEMLSLYDIWHRVSGSKSAAANAENGGSTAAASDGSASETPVVASSAACSTEGNTPDNGSQATTGQQPFKDSSTVDPAASINIGDGHDMFRRLAKMRERRREDLQRRLAV